MPHRPLATLLILTAMAPHTLAAPIVNSGDDWRYRRGTSAPQAGWQTIGDSALDGSWLTGPGGIGYGDGDDATVLSDMENGYRTVYIRREVTVGAGELPAAEEIILSIDYDDAYIAYIDGVEVARSALAPGAPGSEPSYDLGGVDLAATREAGSPESTNLGLAPDALPPRRPRPRRPRHQREPRLVRLLAHHQPLEPEPATAAPLDARR